MHIRSEWNSNYLIWESNDNNSSHKKRSVWVLQIYNYLYTIYYYWLIDYMFVPIKFRIGNKKFTITTMT